MLKQRFVLQFASQFGIKLLGLAAGLIVARVAGPEVLGIIAFGTAYVSVWGFITGLFGTGHIKLISEGQPIGACLTTYTWLQGVSMLLYVLVVLGVFFFQKFYLENFFESRTQEIVIFLLLLAFIVDQVLVFGSVTFTATLEQFKANYPLVIKAAIYNVGRILIVLLGFRAIGLAATSVIGAFLAAPIAWKFIRKLNFGSVDRVILKRHLSYAAPVSLIVIIDAVMEYADKLLLVHYTNTQELGYYSAAFSISGIFLLVSNSSNTVFFPLFSSLIAEEKWESVNEKIERFQSFIALFIFPVICLLIIVGAPFLIALIGEKYQASVLPFKILLFATYLSIIGMPYGNIIAGMGLFYLEGLIRFVGLVVFVISIFLLINPRYLGLGAIGIAITLLIQNGMRNLLYLLFSYRMGRVEFKASVLAPYTLIVVVSVGFFYLESFFSDRHSLWWLLVSVAYLITVYLSMYKFGLLTEKEIGQLRDVLNVKKIREYMGWELRNRR